ncbi:MAG: calcium-binding protein, partial [Burkholderiaceae bacterium]
SDWLDGGSGNDFLAGGAGGDHYRFERGFGQDTIDNTDSDLPRPGEEDEIIFGPTLARSDLLFSQAGVDLVIEVLGSDDRLTVASYFAQGASTSSFVERIRVGDVAVDVASAVAASAHPIVGSDSKQDDLHGTPGDDFIYGLGQTDFLHGGAGDDCLFGGLGAFPDFLYGDAGNDVLDGQADGFWDRLEGGPGADTFIFGLGYGADDAAGIFDPDGVVRDHVVLRSDIRPEDLMLSRTGDDGRGLLISIAGTGDSLNVWSYFHPLAESMPSDFIRFSDGSSWSRSDVAERLWTVGADGDDTLLSPRGFGARLYGGLGKDELWGDLGSDTLMGGEDADILRGGPGNDTYVFRPGDGHDTIDEYYGLASDFDTIAFAAGVTVEMVSASREAMDMVLTYGDDDSVTIVDWYVDPARQIERVTFADGSRWDAEALAALASPNVAPIVAVVPRDQWAVETEGFAFALEPDTFTDANAGDILVLSASLGDGTPLPEWLHFESGNGVFGGVAPDTAAGQWDLQVEARDGSGASASVGFRLTIANIINGSDAADTLLGTALPDFMYGFAGNDKLNGRAGADTMMGGLGNDVYVVADSGDTVVEEEDEGADLVQSNIDFTLGANLENLTLTGTASIDGMGNELRNRITGNAAANTLSGMDGNDTLNGGAGADLLIGGKGSDTYVVDNAGDLAVELVDEGIDTVRSTVDYTLGENLENLSLLGAVAVRATGNELANTIVGNNADNLLEGCEGDDLLNGGLGADTMSGGTGNDIFIVDDVSDRVLENPSEGTDLIKSGVSYALPDHVENITLTGAGAIDAWGNAGDNVLTGNAAANRLEGGLGKDRLVGGSGADTLWGGADDDTLVGGAGNDVYRMTRGDGRDLIQDKDATPGNADVAVFEGGIAADQLWFRRTGNNLEISVIGTADKFTVGSWYVGSQYHVEQFGSSDGLSLLDSQVQNLVSAMAAFAPPPMGQTNLADFYASQLAPVIAANWH